MKAVVLTGYGGIDKLEVRQWPDPHAGPNEVVVRMAAASINPIDWKVRSGAPETARVDFPKILGRDASGTVIEVGSGVTSFALGDRVLGLVRAAYAELIAASVESWAKVPPGLDLVFAGALPLVLLTGAQLIEQAVNPAAGDTVLVTGAAGSVGRVAVCAAKERGARVWAGVRRSQRAQASAVGADGVVAIDDDEDIAQLPTLDAIADTVGGNVMPKLLGKIRPGGIIGSVVGEPAGAKERGLTVRAFMVRPDPAMLGRYASAVAQKKLSIPIAKTFPLERAGEAHKLAETGQPGGKVLLVVHSGSN
jgi:NADPH:quinone reductase-like Zn-dependent oxidoreductase